MNFPAKKLADWQALAQKELKTKPLEALYWDTPEGIRIKPLYTAEDLQNLDVSSQLPGFAPYTRGVRGTMYSGRAWTIRQYAGFSTAEESNAFYKRNLAAGQKGLSVAFDLATHRGYDSDHPRVMGDVGKAGVAIDSLEDMKLLFADIPLSDISVSMTMNGAVLPILAFYIVAAEEQGISPDQLAGTIQNDILKEFMVRNTYIFAPEPSMRIVADIIEYTSKHMPRFNSISISGYHMHEAGATAVEELAFTIADGEEYVKAAMEKGLDIDSFAPRLSFFFGIGMHFFMEVAKLRAARVLWARIMQNLGAQNSKSLMLRTHCQTSGVSLQAQDPYNNVIRTTVEAMAAVLGGTQSLHTNALDEAIALPTDFSARIARNTQLILEHETGITPVVDPLGGSYYIESLTHSLVEHAWAEIENIRAMGGMTHAIEKGVPKRKIEASAARKQARIDGGEEVIVGVNRFQPSTIEALDTLEVDNSKVRDGQIARLKNIRESRDNDKCAQALEALTKAAETGGKNLLQAHIEAARERATLGEMTAALEKIFPRYDAPVEVATGVYKDSYGDVSALEAIQQRNTEIAAVMGGAARIYIAKMGQDGHDRGAKIIASAYSDLGFEVVAGHLFQTPQEAAQVAVDKKAHILGVSTQAGAHKTLVPEVIAALKSLNAENMIVVCGGVIPSQDYQALYDAGVAAIFPPGTPIPKSANELLDILELRHRKGNYFVS
ncbi:MAG: methylmalonyl-CoA mutase [Alphaproteobacteria bacterium]|nr:methylmalonyl-CoA mutase [Alphaproteobacteria bacterium]